MLSIVYPASGNHSDFTYDPFGRNVKILEYTGSSLTSTKQFVWSGYDRQEERNSSGSLTKQFCRLGETISGTNYFFTLDHLNSIREMTDISGNVQAEYGFDPFGRTTKLKGSLDADFQYAGYYAHLRSSLSLTPFRAYNSTMGRWINHEPFDDPADLYSYSGNEPVNNSDWLGLLANTPCRKSKGPDWGTLAGWASTQDDPTPVTPPESDDDSQLAGGGGGQDPGGCEEWKQERIALIIEAEAGCRKEVDDWYDRREKQLTEEQTQEYKGARKKKRERLDKKWRVKWQILNELAAEKYNQCTEHAERGVQKILQEKCP